MNNIDKKNHQVFFIIYLKNNETLNWFKEVDKDLDIGLYMDEGYIIVDNNLSEKQISHIQDILKEAKRNNLHLNVDYF